MDQLGMELQELRTLSTRENALLIYVKNASMPGSDNSIDSMKVERLLEEGADTNAALEGTGQTVMHILAMHWKKEVADLLVLNNVDINKKDKNGLSPLHTAAAANHMEVLEWLIAHGADLEARTHRESQTPLHYGARQDSIKALKCLLERGSDLEAKDYRGRTALHLAIQLDRGFAAECLISLPTPADIRTQDNLGNAAMASMISANPRAACMALDQLHHVNIARKTETFNLSSLEPDMSSSCSQTKTPFEAAVEEKRKYILTHSVMKNLLKIKWKFIRPFFFIHLAIYLVFTVLWSIDFSFPSVQEKHIYSFPRDSWRVIVEVFIVIIYMATVFSQALSVVLSIKNLRAYNKCCRDAIQTDIDTLILSKEEHEVLQSKFSQLKIIPEYIRDPWTAIAVFTNVLILVMIITHAGNVAHHSSNIALWEGRIGCFTTIMIWMQLVKFLRASSRLGPIVAIMVAVFEDIVYFLFIGAIIYVPFALSFWVMFGGDQSANITGSERQALQRFYDVAMMVFRLGLIDDYPFEAMRDIDRGMTYILVAAFLLLMAIVGINLFIALLSNVVEHVYEASHANALLQQALLIRSYGKKVWFFDVYKRYYKYIHKQCNPYIRVYDDRHCIKPRKANEPLTKVLDHLHAIRQQVERMDQEIGELKTTMRPISAPHN